jgi:co-chaperonin GroES (HSP10)
MSDLILPPGVSMPKPIQTAEKPDESASAEQKAKQLPDPVGWKLLCVVPDVEDKFEGTGIVKADTYKKAEEHGTTVLFVLKVGDLAYKDAARFPTGPWCKEGDWVLVRTYSGTRIKIYGKEFRIINDDMVEAVVEDPRGVTRVAA